MARGGVSRADETIVVTGLRELLAEIDKTDRKTKRLLRDDLRAAAEPVRDQAQSEFMSISPHSARNYRTTVRKTGVVSVEQRLRKTTRKRPDFGVLQMRKALLPSLRTQAPKVVRSLEAATERILEKLNRTGA